MKRTTTSGTGALQHSAQVRCTHPTKEVVIMGRAVLQACLPWLALLVASFAVAYLLVRLNRRQRGTPFRLGRLRELHRDQG